MNSSKTLVQISRLVFFEITLTFFLCSLNPINKEFGLLVFGL